MSKDLTHIAAVVNQMRDVKDSIARLNERYDLLKKTVIDELAGDTSGTIDGRPAVNYQSRITRRFDTKAFQAAQPDVYDAFRVETEATYFTLVDPEADNG